MPESAPFEPIPPRPGEGFPRPWWRRLPPRLSLRPLLREALGRLRGYSLTRQPPPPASDALGSAAYGAAQPILGMRILAADAKLLREAFIPAGWLALFCAVIAALGAGPGDPGLLTKGGGGLLAFAAAFYKIFAALAVAPPILFANHYARLAAQVRYQLGFGACAPREASLWFFAKRSAQSVILVAFAVAPFYLLEQVPIVGYAAAALLGLWGLHWVVVDALDDARVLLPGETLKSARGPRAFLGAHRRAPAGLPGASVRPHLRPAGGPLPRGDRAPRAAPRARVGLRRGHQRAARDPGAQPALPAHHHRRRLARARPPRSHRGRARASRRAGPRSFCGGDQRHRCRLNSL